MRRISLSLATLAFAAIAPIAGAQSASTGSKLTLDLRAGMASGMIDDNDTGLKTKGGADYGVSLGYDVTPAIRLGLGLGLSKQPLDVTGVTGDVGVSQFDLGARYSFVSAQRRWTPFLSAAVSPRALSFEEDGGSKYEASGTGFSVGAGMDYAFSPKIAFQGTLGYVTGKFGDWKVDGDKVDAPKIDANGMHVNFGVSFRPFAR